MICKNCGTECRGSYCSHCGQPLVNEAFTPVAEVQEESPAHTPTATSASADAPERTASPEAPPRREEGGRVAPRPRNKKARHRLPWGRPRITLRQVLAPALALLLPLLYLFTDCFAVFPDALYGDVGGVSALELLISRLSSPDFATNPQADIVAATYGTPISLVTRFTLLAALGAEAPALLKLPALLLLAAALLGALTGLMLLLTRGHLLHGKRALDCVMTVGLFAATAPLFADLIIRLAHLSGGLAGADAAIAHVSLSLEALLIFAVTLLLTLPAVRTLRRLAEGEHIYLGAPLRLIGVGNFKRSRTLAGLFALAAIGTAASAFFQCQLGERGSVLSVAIGALPSLGADVKALLAAFVGAAPEALVPALQNLFALVLTVAVLVLAVLAAVCAIRVLFITPQKAMKKRRRKSLLGVGALLRGAPVALLGSLAGARILLSLLLLIGTSLKSHVDLFSIEETLSLLYTVIAYARTKITLSTAAVLATALSFAFAALGGGFAKSLVVITRIEPREN